MPMTPDFPQLSHDLAALCETYPTGRETPPVARRPPAPVSACRASPGGTSWPSALALLAGIGAAAISASRSSRGRNGFLSHPTPRTGGRAQESSADVAAESTKKRMPSR